MFTLINKLWWSEYNSDHRLNHLEYTMRQDYSKVPKERKIFKTAINIRAVFLKSKATFWVIGVFILVLATVLISQLGGQLSLTSDSNALDTNTNTKNDTNVVFEVNGFYITLAQWHSAVQNEFTKRVKAGQYTNGNSNDDKAINTAAMHDIVDPFAIQEIASTHHLGSGNNINTRINAVIPTPAMTDNDIF